MVWLVVLAALVAGALVGAGNVMVTQSHAVWPTVLQIEQRIPADFVGARSGQLVAMCCGLPQVKHACFYLTASAESHIAVSSLSGMLQQYYAVLKCYAMLYSVKSVGESAHSKGEKYTPIKALGPVWA